MGVLTVIGFHLAWVPLMASVPPVSRGTIFAAIVVGSTLSLLGIYIYGRTRAQRAETDRLRQISQAHDADRQKLAALLHRLTDAVFVVDAQGLISDCNAAAEALAEGTALRGQPFNQVLRLYPHVDLDSKPVNLLKTNAPQHRRDLSIKLASDAVIDLDISVEPVQVEGKRSHPDDFIIICRDITKERSLDEQRNEFISVASHELRTPISIVEASLSLAMIRKDKFDLQTLELITQAHRNCLYLGDIVKGLVIMSEANDDNLPIQMTNVDSDKLLHQLANDFAPQAAQKGLRLQVSVEEGTPVILSTTSHIQEIMQNYITNALKYSPQGDITLRAAPAKGGGVRYSVQDNGIGLSPSDQKHLFTKFFQAEDFRTREVGGSGLGLYLCNQLAQRLNGRVWCESELNKGSTFFLEVPPVSYLKRDQGEVVQAEVANLMTEL